MPTIRQQLAYGIIGKLISRVIAHVATWMIARKAPTRYVRPHWVRSWLAGDSNRPW